MDLVPGRIIVDPAAASFKVQLRQDGAWGLTDADNDVLYGIRLMASLLASGSLKISDRCSGLIGEIPGYSWDSKAQLQGHDKPIKTADHSLDAARYALATTERKWRARVDHRRYKT
nr:MAG TPA: large terminase [Bacteriophage sp.]